MEKSLFLSFLIVLLLVIVRNADSAAEPEKVPENNVPETNATEKIKQMLKCVPGKVFTYDHNICYCDDAGSEITCKRKLYTTLTPDLHRIQLQNVTVECEPGQYFEQPCRECVCHESGKYASCVYARCGKADAQAEKPDSCTPGAVFNVVCNGCICGAEGKAACTDLDCRALLGGIFSSDNQCVPESNLMVRCNDCECKKDGKSMYCEKMGCEPMAFYHEHILHLTMKCNASSIFDYNCHQCICSESGDSAMCSGKSCPHKYKFTKVENTVDNCDPGVIFAKDCNVCICGKEGKGYCTTHSCTTSYRFKYVDELNFVIPVEEDEPVPTPEPAVPTPVPAPAPATVKPLNLRLLL